MHAKGLKSELNQLGRAITRHPSASRHQADVL